MKTLLALWIALLACSCFAQQGALKLIHTIPLPGVQGRFDHFALDVKGQRLFVAALGNNTLEVIDIAALKRIQSVPGMSKPTGVLHVPETQQVFVANGDEGVLKVLDAADFKSMKVLTHLEDADNLRYDTKGKLAWLGYADGALGIVDVWKMKEVGQVKLAKHPESFQLEQKGNRLFVNVPDAKHVAVVDREKRSVVATWPLRGFDANFPMALDEAGHRLFIGCRNPARLVVMSTDTGGVITDVGISGDTDDLFYDVAHHRLYLSCGEGFIDVIHQLNPGEYRRVEQIPTRAGARTGFFSPELNQFYLAVPQRGDQVAELRIFKVQD